MLRGCGDTHVAVALERLARKFGVNVETEDVRVPYRETIIGTAEAEGKVKKQSGGHGQYAVANLRVTPKGRGDGSEFKNSIVGGDDPEAVHPGRAAAASRRRWPPAASTASPSSTCWSSATTASSTPSTPPTWRSDRRPPGPQGGAGQGRLGGARADLAAHGPGARGPPGRRARRPQLTARAGQRHQLDRRRPARDRRPRAGGRDPALRRRAALDDRRPGHVLRGARPLRHPPEPPRVEDQDGRDQRRATDRRLRSRARHRPWEHARRADRTDDARAVPRPRPDRRAGRAGDGHPRRPGSRRDQGRAAGRRGVARRGPARRRRAGGAGQPALPRLQPRQAQRRARPRRRRRPPTASSTSSPPPTSCSRTPARGVMDGRGLGFTALCDVRPDLVYVALVAVRPGRPVRPTTSPPT